MRLELLLPPIDPEEWQAPSRCPYAKCGGRHFRLHQVVGKPVRDTCAGYTLHPRHPSSRVVVVYPRSTT